MPIIGTYSNARFIAAYLDWLVQTGSSTTLNVQGKLLSAVEIQNALRAATIHVHQDVIVDGKTFIDAAKHPAEYALFHNRFGVVDGNAYGFLVNPLGVAVFGFPSQGPTPSKKISFKNVHITSQRAFINEVIALNQGGRPAVDPIGAVFMVRNVHPDTGAPLTVSSLDESKAVYTGNVVANAQALVAKAALNGEFPSFLDVTRLNITQEVLTWIESGSALSTIVQQPTDYLCNGDTMFHVNKGVIGFKMDGAQNVTMKNTSVDEIENFGTLAQECAATAASPSGDPRGLRWRDGAWLFLRGLEDSSAQLSRVELERSSGHRGWVRHPDRHPKRQHQEVLRQGRRRWQLLRGDRRPQ